MQAQDQIQQQADPSASKKLVFKRETLRQLTNEELRRVAGGYCTYSVKTTN